LYYYLNCDTGEDLENVILFGEFEIVTDKSLKDKLWKDDFLQFYKNGKDDELYCVLKFTPVGYKYYSFEADGPQKNEGNF
jgi:general stress protein 26